MDIRDQETIEVRSPVRRRFLGLPRLSTLVIAPATVAAVAVIGAVMALGMAPRLRAYVEAVRPGARHLTIEVSPPQARVFIDERFAGSGRVGRLVRPGPRLVRVVLDGYKTWRDRVDVRATPRVRIALERAEIATLIVESEPEGAAVFLNGEPRGTTPCTLRHVEAGSYTVRIRKEPYLEVTQQVDLEAGDTRRICVQLESSEELRYLENIKQSPERLSNYTELLHLYTERQETAKAAKLLPKILQRLKTTKPPLTEQSQLCLELVRVCGGEGGEIEPAIKAKALDGAFAVFEKLVRADPEKTQLYDRIVDKMNCSGQFARIVRLCDRLAKDPQIGIRVHRNIARLFLRWGKHDDQAIALLERAAAVRPSDFLTRYHLATLYEKKDKVDEALAQYRAAEKLISPKSPYSYYQGRVHAGLASLLARRSDVEGAIAQYKKAIQGRTPLRWNLQWRYALAQLLLENNRREEAIEQYRQIRTLAPSDTYRQRAIQRLKQLGAE